MLLARRVVVVLDALARQTEERVVVGDAREPVTARRLERIAGRHTQDEHQVHANKTTEIDEVGVGNIAAAPVFVQSCKQGTEDALTRGPLLGYPIVDTGVTLTAAGFREGDSNDASFQAAAAMATMQAFEEAGAVLLEPTMAVEVVVPDDFTGNVVSDLNGRRGRIMGMEPARAAVEGGRSTAQIVKAEVPLAEMVGYATAIRSATQGRASYTMQFSQYDEVPKDVQAAIVARLRGY